MTPATETSDNETGSAAIIMGVVVMVLITINLVLCCRAWHKNRKDEKKEKKREERKKTKKEKKRAQVPKTVKKSYLETTV